MSSAPHSGAGGLRVAFVIRDLGYGGAQRQLLILATGLAARGWPVAVVHFYPGPLEEQFRAGGVETFCVGKKHRWDLAGFFVRLVRATRAFRPDIIHGYLAESNLMALFLRPFCRGAKVIWGVRDSKTDAHLWGVLGRGSFRLNSLLSGFADGIIANSRSGRAYYLDQGYPAARTVVVPNGIDAERFCPDPAAGAEVRCGWGIAGEQVLFGLVGRLNAMKDHPTFLHAAATVAKTVPSARFVCVGGGSDSYAAEMRALAGRLGLADRVIWSPPREDTPAVFNALDVLVNASAFGEGFSNVIGEAMACARPCIVSDVGDSVWLVGESGVAFEPGDSEGLARAMARMAGSSPGDRARLGNKGRRRVVECFSTQQLVERTAELCAKIYNNYNLTNFDVDT